jgi:hypothetical protein
MADPTNADAALQALFASYGLSSLAPQILGYAQQGLSPDESMLKLQETKEWKARFQGNEIRRQKGLNVLSPAEYLSREDAYSQQMRQYGLPAGFYDHPDDFAKAIGADLGGQELGQRLDARKAIVEDGAHTGVLDWARQAYGLDTGDLIAFFTDPDRAAPLLSRMAAASQVGAAAARTKWGDVSTADAERLAALGVGADQASAGFSTAAGLKELTSDLAGGQSEVTQQNLVDAVFTGDATAKAAVTRKQDERKATFAGGGAYAQSQTGIAGLGSANT